MMDYFQYAKDHWLLNNYWTAHYTFINACNDVIHEVDSLNLTDAGSLINKGEATFFRAYAYFDLVRDYGDVPIVTKKVYTPTDGNKPKSPVTQVYAQIEADLTFAAQNLPATWGAQYPGRVTKGPANALLAIRMDLTLGSIGFCKILSSIFIIVTMHTFESASKLLSKRS
jgi:hypothetical protein